MLSIFKFFTLFISFLSIAYPVMAQETGESGGNAQSPVQVIVQVVITAIVLKILKNFNLP